MTDESQAGRRFLLTVDIGNTNVTIGAFDDDMLVRSWRISTQRHRMADEYYPLLFQLLGKVGVPFSDLKAAVISSVVPPVLHAMAEALESENVPVTILSAQSDLGMRIDYQPPTSVGADRLVNALAVQKLYGRPAIIVDLGTATTLDVVDTSGAYVGGAIAPGIETSIEGLFRTAFQLPRLALDAPSRAIGKTTTESIQSGTLLGYASLVDGLIDRFLEELDGEPHIVGTGGLAPLVAPHTRHVRTVNSELTLEGLRMAHERLQSAKQSR